MKKKWEDLRVCVYVRMYVRVYACARVCVCASLLSMYVLSKQKLFNVNTALLRLVSEIIEHLRFFFSPFTHLHTCYSAQYTRTHPQILLYKPTHVQIFLYTQIYPQTSNTHLYTHYSFSLHLNIPEYTP